jgi:hypothetical protein
MLPFSVVLLHQIHCYAIGLLRYYGNAIKLIVTQHTQQELLRYYGNLICHNMNQDIKEWAKLNCGATKEQFVNYCTDFWTDVTYEHKN